MTSATVKKSSALNAPKTTNPRPASDRGLYVPSLVVLLRPGYNLQIDHLVEYAVPQFRTHPMFLDKVHLPFQYLFQIVLKVDELQKVRQFFVLHQDINVALLRFLTMNDGPEDSDFLELVAFPQCVPMAADCAEVCMLSVAAGSALSVR